MMATIAAIDAPRTVEATVNYVAEMQDRPRYYAVDHTRNHMEEESRTVTISDVRSWVEPPQLDREGFILVEHRSAVKDFWDRDEVMRVHRREIEELVKQVSGADWVVVAAPGFLRFSEKSPDAGKLLNSGPARSVHVDFAKSSARLRAQQLAANHWPRVRRFAHYNVWRALSPPPQDAPLALVDARTVDPSDFVVADLVYDMAASGSEWSVEGLVIRPNPRHRWAYYSNVTRDEAIIFKTSESDPNLAQNAPHSAFDDPSCPPGAPPRMSIEMRAVAFWLS